MHCALFLVLTAPLLVISITAPIAEQRSKKSTVFSVHSQHDHDYEERGLIHNDLSTEYIEHPLEAHSASGSAVADLTRVLDGFVFFNNLYDMLVRPGQFSDSGPTIIHVGLDVHPGFHVNPSKNEMTVTVTLTQNWTDARLAYESRVKNPEKLPFVILTGSMHQLEPWLPDTFIMNEKRQRGLEIPGASGADMIKVDPNGVVTREQRCSKMEVASMTVTVHCPFDENEYFPFDTHICDMKFTSFSWNLSQLQYEGMVNSCWLDLSTSGVFTIQDCNLEEVVFQRDEYKLGNSSGFVKRFELKRNLSHYVSKVFIPLALFTLISIVGLMNSIGPEIGSALSYFMFGLMSIFMALTFRGQDFSWGYKGGRTALDSYFVYCVVTVILSGFVNLLKLHLTPNKSSGVQESFEMHNQSTSHSHNNNGSMQNSSSLWTDSDNILDDTNDQIYEEVNEPRSRFSYLKVVVKSSLIRLKTLCGALCCRINECSVWCTVLVFISWNLMYWIYWLSYYYYAHWRLDVF